VHGVHRDLYRPRCGGIYGKEAEEVRTREQLRRERRSETITFIGIMVLLGLVFAFGMGVGLACG